MTNLDEKEVIHSAIKEDNLNDYLNNRDIPEENERHAFSTETDFKIKSRIKYKEELVDKNIVLSVRHLKQFFTFGSGRDKTKLKAVNDVSFDVHKGECVGIVGESGCGKTTTGRSIIRLYDITSGSVYFKGYRIAAGTRWNEKEIKYTKIRLNKFIKDTRKKMADELKNATESEKFEIKNKYEGLIDSKKEEAKLVIDNQKRKIKSAKYDHKHINHRLVNQIQMIFQDPVDSLDPRMTVQDIIEEGLIIQEKKQRIKTKQDHTQIIADILTKVGLIPEFASRYPHEFSGGQRQRIGIARALVMNPELLICDEPISALDVSIRAQIINLLNDLKQDLNLSIIFIAHDLSVVKYFCDRICVMYFGKIVEEASSEELFNHPLHPYTKALLSAIPRPDPHFEKNRSRIIYNPSETHDYSKQAPSMKEISPRHYVLCNDEEFARYEEELKASLGKVEEVEPAKEKMAPKKRATKAKAEK